MKLFLSFITILTLLNISACQKSSDKDEEIQREEEIDRDNVVEKRNMETPHQLDLDRDVMDVNDFKLDK